ncbi:hypothetical protein L0F63_006809 [Massospora cicadina]|nr:hypothetical protein L0F63_006809 [Massospora cicadina]
MVVRFWIICLQQKRSLVDHSRRGVNESQCLEEINEKWNQISRREVKPQAKPPAMFNYKYEGTTTIAPKPVNYLVDTVNLEQVADKLTDRDFLTSIDLANARLLPHRARYTTRGTRTSIQPHAPSNPSQQECVIEFTGETLVEVVKTVRPAPRPSAPPEKKMTLLERMQLQVRQGLNKTIRHQKERHQLKDKRQEAELIAAHATNSIHPGTICGVMDPNRLSGIEKELRLPSHAARDPLQDQVAPEKPGVCEKDLNLAAPAGVTVADLFQDLAGIVMVDQDLLGVSAADLFRELADLVMVDRHLFDVNAADPTHFLGYLGMRIDLSVDRAVPALTPTPRSYLSLLGFYY